MLGRMTWPAVADADYPESDGNPMADDTPRSDRMVAKTGHHDDDRIAFADRAEGG